MDSIQNITEYVTKIISAMKSNSSDAVAKMLANGVDWADGWERVSAQLSYNAFETATAVAIEIVISILAEQGVIDIPKSPPNYLQILDFRSDPQESDDE